MNLKLPHIDEYLRAQFEKIKELAAAAKKELGI